MSRGTDRSDEEGADRRGGQKVARCASGLLPDHRRRLPPEQSAEHRCSGPAKRNQFGGLREGVSLCCVFTVLGPLARHLARRRVDRLALHSHLGMSKMLVARGDANLVAVSSTRHYGVAPMSSIKQFQVTFDCAEPERLARFWCEVLGYVVPPPPEGFATWDDFNRSLPPEDQGSWFACIDPSGVGPRLYFQRVPEGKVVKNRVHLDVRVGTGLVGEERLAALEAECARLVPLGAVRVRAPV